MYGDFVNGWFFFVNGINVLQEVFDQCNEDNGVGGEFNNCFFFVFYIDFVFVFVCKFFNFLVDEDVGDGYFISKFFGDNFFWIGDSIKFIYVNYIDDGIGFIDFKFVIFDGYIEVGCIVESMIGCVFIGFYFIVSNMIRGVCVLFCEVNGYFLVG